MKEKMKNYLPFLVTGILLLAALTYIILLKTVDVTNEGLQKTEIGFTTFNKWFFNLTNFKGNTSLKFYNISKVLGFLPFALVLIYGCLGVHQLIKEKSLKKVDYHIFGLVFTYLLMIVVYFFFEKVVLNYRPVLDDGNLAASFPSSHTLFSVVLCGTAILFNHHLYKEKTFFPSKKHLYACDIALALICTTIVVTRTLSGVHWISDVIGGLLIGALIVSLYQTFIKFVEAFVLKINKEE